MNETNQSGRSDESRERNAAACPQAGTSAGLTESTDYRAAAVRGRFMKIVKKAAVEMEKEYERDPDGFEADADPFWPEVDKAMDLWRDGQI